MDSFGKGGRETHCLPDGMVDRDRGRVSQDRQDCDTATADHRYDAIISYKVIQRAPFIKAA